MLVVWGVRAAVVALVVAASWSDLRTGRIRHWLTMPALALGIGVWSWRLGVPGLLLSLLGAGVCFLALVIGVLVGGMGGGDLWLATALGALGGPVFAWSLLLWTGVVAVVALAWMWRTRWRDETLRDVLRRPVTFGPLIGAGALIGLVSSVMR